jgi:hypothetical protein
MVYKILIKTYSDFYLFWKAIAVLRTKPFSETKIASSSVLEILLAAA